MFQSAPPDAVELQVDLSLPEGAGAESRGVGAGYGRRPGDTARGGPQPPVQSLEECRRAVEQLLMAHPHSERAKTSQRRRVGV